MVNERDELGPNLVPDYLTSVREGGFYGWPYSYWGQNVDPRVRPQDPARSRSRSGPTTRWARTSPRWAWLSRRRRWAARFADGVFVGEHGSWNRNTPVGYKVVFVPFRDGRPAGEPVDFVTGFLKTARPAAGRSA